MRTLFLIALLAPVAVPLPLKAATRNYSVTSFERVRVEGPYAISLTTNSAPFARASGTQAALDAVSIRVEGTTLIIQANRSNWGGGNSAPGPVSIAVGTHDLRTASVAGSGSLTIDQVRGLEFSLGIGGAASGRVDRVDVDRLRLTINGSGTATLAGRAATFSAVALGSAVVDAAALQAKDATLTAQGSSSIKATAGNSAKITAAGTSAVAVAGAPACTVKAIGSATVAGCR